jgi:hypothetical protein
VSSGRLAEERELYLEGVGVDQGGPGALDARGEDGLAPEAGTGEQVGVRQGAAKARELAQGPVGLRERGDERQHVIEPRRKDGGYEGLTPCRLQ